MQRQPSRTYPADYATDVRFVRPAQTTPDHGGPIVMAESELTQVAAAGSKPGMVGDGYSPPTHRSN